MMRMANLKCLNVLMIGQKNKNRKRQIRNNEELDFTLALLFYWDQVCNLDYKNSACDSDYKNEKIWDGIFDGIDQIK